MTDLQATKAAASPTKGFFVTMLTRDITLEDCILDLIDNSVDGAWRCEGSRPMGLADGADLSEYSIEIDASSERFAIRDNCGGMTLDDAANHAFSFGRKHFDSYDQYSIGVYGIGMKRAVFKLGSEIQIRSTYKDEHSSLQTFSVPISVKNWLQNDAPPWDFDIEPSDALPEAGVEVVVNELTAGAVASFGSPAFIQDLRRTIARDYSLHLNRGLRISVNGAAIAGWQIELRESDDFKAMRLEYEDELDGDKVSIEVIGGMAAAPPESSEPDEEDDGDKRYGWYVVCNGRIVLAADKTTISGWGTETWPQWHRQYSGFIGIILFTAAKAEVLPMTTTKRSVDTSSEIYRRAGRHMREVSRKWIDYTNQRKQDLEEAKRKEAQARSVPIYSLQRQSVVTLPTLVPRATERVANVTYSVPLSKMKTLSRELGAINLTFKEVGLRSFNYTYDDLVGDK